MSPLAVQGDFISDLPVVMIPRTELPGGFIEVEVPTGPGGALVSKRLGTEQLEEYVGGTAQARTYWPVIYLTRAQAIADGRPDNASLDQILALSLCTGSVARVDLHPDKYGQWMIAVYDDRADPTVGLRGFIDGNFLRSTQTYDGLQPLKWVKMGSADEALAGVRRYTSTYANWRQDETMKIDFNGTDAFFSAVAAGGPFPAPTAAGVATADWKPTTAPAATGGGGGGPAGAVYRDPYDVPTAKALQVIASYQAANGPFAEKNEAYFGRVIIDDYTVPGDEFRYECSPSRPANQGGATVWKWRRYEETGV